MLLVCLQFHLYLGSSFSSLHLSVAELLRYLDLRIMAVSSSVTFLVAMGFLKVVLLMLMSSSCTIAAEISNVAPGAPGHISASGRSHHADDGRSPSSADDQRPLSSLSSKIL